MVGRNAEDAPMWTGQAMIQPGWAVFLGTAGDQVPHRHHAVQVALGVHGPVELWEEKGGKRSAPGIVIPADRAHQLAPGPAPLLLLYLERESTLGRSLDDWCGARARLLPKAGVRLLIDLLGQPKLVSLPTLQKAVAIIRESTQEPGGHPFTDPRIVQALDHLPRPLPEDLTAATLARQVGLSASRFAHLFRAHASMPLRPYLRWLRLQQALVEIAQGSNLTEAAHTAGFSDSAHLSRTFRRTFGIAPQILLNPALKIISQQAEHRP